MTPDTDALPAEALLRPDWPAPATVRAASTTRLGGLGRDRYASFNLAAHVGDDAGVVQANRARLRRALSLAVEPAWLAQQHGTDVVPAHDAVSGCAADGSWTDRPGMVCAVLTADCLPILLCNRAGTRVAALHAGWRGLAAGVLEAGVRALGVPPAALMAWLGPAIGPAAFQVGPEVRARFLDGDPDHAGDFRRAGPGHWSADLYALARRRLGRAGVRAVYGGGWCTHTERHLFFSYRRDGVTGRMASVIWLHGGV